MKIDFLISLNHKFVAGWDYNHDWIHNSPLTIEVP